MDTNSTVKIDERNFVYVNGVKIGRFFSDTGDLEFQDPDTRRCRERGTKYVKIKFYELYTQLLDKQNTVLT